MSKDLVPKLVRDPRLAVVDQIDYSVYSGPLLNNYQELNSNSCSNSSANFQIQTPNNQTILGRDPLVKTTTTTTFKIEVNSGDTKAYVAAAGNAPATPGDNVWWYGVNTCLQAFPMAHMIQDANLSIANTASSMQ